MVLLFLRKSPLISTFSEAFIEVHSIGVRNGIVLVFILHIFFSVFRKCIVIMGFTIAILKVVFL